MKEEEKGVASSSPPDNAAANAPANDTAVTSSDIKESQKLLGTVNWGAATIVGVFAGLLYGGSKEVSASVSKDVEVLLKLGSTPDKREQYRIMRDAMEKTFIFVVHLLVVFVLACLLQHFMARRACWLRKGVYMTSIMWLVLALLLLRRLAL